MRAASDERRGWLWWAACAAGWSVMGVAVWGIVAEVDVVGFGRWFVGGLLIHDGLVAPIAAVIGTLCARRIRDRRTRDALTWGLWVTLLVVVAWWPSLTGAGLHADNPSILPRPYVRNAVIVAAVVAVVVALRAGVRRRRPLGEGLHR